MINKADFVAVPSQDSERSRRFYGETLGLRPDKHGQFEFWAGATCLGIWEPERLGMTLPLRRMGTSRFMSMTSIRPERSSRPRAWVLPATRSTPACARWRSSPIPTATT